MHTAPIRRVATDATGHYLVTGSDDKTVRLWDLDTGSLCLRAQPLCLRGKGTRSAALCAPLRGFPSARRQHKGRFAT